MKLKEKIIRNTATIAVQGSIISPLDMAPLKTRICTLIKNNIKYITIDLSQVQWFGAAMLGTLVEALSITRDAGGDLQLSGINLRIAQILKLAKLDHIFQTTSQKQTHASDATKTSIASDKIAIQNFPTGAKAASARLKKLHFQDKTKVYVIGGGALKVVV